GRVDGAVLPRVEVALANERVHHAGQPEPLAVLGREDGDPVLPQFGDLGRHDHPTAAPEDADVGRPGGGQGVDQVLEVLDVTALVGRDGDALHVLLDGGVHDLFDRTVVPQVDDLGPLGLQDPPHDV